MNGIEIEITSASYSTSADRASAEGTKNRTAREAVTGFFKAAITAITQRKDDDAPQPEARKRRSGEKEGGPLLVTRHILRAGRPAARGQYAALHNGKAKAGKVASRFSRAANDAAASDDYDTAALYLADTLAVFYQQNNEAFDAGFDDYSPVRHTCETFEP